MINQLDFTPDCRGLQAFKFRDQFRMFYEPRDLPLMEILVHFLRIGLNRFLRGGVSGGRSGCASLVLFLGRGVLPLSKTKFHGAFVQCHGFNTSPNESVVSKPIIRRNILWVSLDFFHNLLLRLENGD